MPAGPAALLLGWPHPCMLIEELAGASGGGATAMGLLPLLLPSGERGCKRLGPTRGVLVLTKLILRRPTRGRSAAASPGVSCGDEEGERMLGVLLLVSSLLGSYCNAIQGEGSQSRSSEREADEDEYEEPRAGT